MICGKDFNKNFSKQKRSLLPPITHPWLLRGIAFVIGISLLSVVLATTHRALEPGRFTQTIPIPKTTQDLLPINHATQTASEAPTTTQWQTIRIAPGDSASKIFSDLAIHSQLHSLLKLPKVKETLTKLIPGRSLEIKIEDGKLTDLRYAISPIKRLEVATEQGQFVARMMEDKVEHRLVEAQGHIEQSLFLAGKAAGITDNLIMQLVDIFAYDIDYALDIRSGDRFKIIYEERYAGGRKLKDGAILAAQFINQNKRYEALRYTDAKGVTAYYAPDGRSLKKAFIRTPVKFTRISSHFNPKRLHPVLHTIRAHRGVDYAAPTGTPVKATGAGKVIFKGKKNGYGNTIVLKHGRTYSTLYAHLSGFKKGLQTGQRVQQGQVIGYVGQTGRATGPHLHYEFRINGVHKNPVTVELPKAPPLAKAEKETFQRQTQALLAQLETEHHIAAAAPSE